MADGLAVGERMLLWQAQGHVDTNAKTAQEMLKAADLDWDVKMLPVLVESPDGKGTIADTKRRAIVRSDTHQILGVAKSRYVESTNREVFAFLDSLFDTGEAKYEAAWQWRGGETVGVAMRIPTDVLIAGFDKHSCHILAKTSHDGGGSVIVAATLVRTDCTNMVTAQIKGAQRVFRAQHTSSLEGRVAEARQSLQVTYKYADAWEKEVEKLLDEKVTSDTVLNLATEIYGPKHAPVVLDRYETAANIADFRDTKYGAYNALTEYGQWIRPRAPQLESVMLGPIARQSDRAYQLLTA